MTPAGPLLRESLDFTLRHWDKLFGVALGVYMPFLLAAGLVGLYSSLGVLLTFLGLQIAGATVTLVIWRLLRGEVFDPIADAQFVLARLFPLAALSFLISLIVGLGLVALIVPGVYLMAALLLVTPVFLLEGNALRAPARSWDLTEAHRWTLFTAIGVAGVLIVTGAYLAFRFAGTLGIASGVGLLLDTLLNKIVLVFAAVLSMRVYTELAPKNPPMR